MEDLPRGRSIGCLKDWPRSASRRTCTRTISGSQPSRIPQTHLQGGVGSGSGIGKLERSSQRGRSLPPQSRNANLSDDDSPAPRSKSATPLRDRPLLDQAVDAGTSKVTYNKCIQLFKEWMAPWGLDLESLKANPSELDDQVVSYLQYLFVNRKPKYLGTSLISALCDLSPKLKGLFPCATRAGKAWQDMEPGDCRNPWPVALVLALLAIAFLKNQPAVGTAL